MGGFFTKIFSKLSGKKELKIIIIGLDNSGKTTILNKLHLNEIKQTVPTIGFNMETVEYKNLKFQVWDLGGQNSIRYFISPILKTVLGNVLPLHQRHPLCCRQQGQTAICQSCIVTIKSFECLQKQILENVPLLVLANKQDLPDAASEKEISEVLGLTKIKNRDWSIYKCSAVTGKGLNESMDWLVEKLSSNS